LGDPATVVAEANAVGVTRLIAMGVDIDRSRNALALAQSHTGVWAGVGHHPEERSEPDLAALRQLAGDPRVVAIGEVGLDFEQDNSLPRDVQVARLGSLFSLAVELDLPVSIHNRGAASELAGVIAMHPGLRGVMHYFALEWDWAERFLELGFHLSFAGLVTRPSRHALREVARRCPEDRLLLETDSPYGNAQKRMGVPNRPAYLIDTAEVIAGLRGLSVDALSELEEANALRLFTRMA
jgi:TatD DNase family protein